MANVGEIKRQAMLLANDLEGVTVLNQSIENDFNQLLAELDLIISGTSSDDLLAVPTGIKETISKLEQEKQLMMSAVIDIQGLAQRL